MRSQISFRVLGPLEIDRDGEVEAGGAKFQAVVSLLLLNEGQVVGTDALLEAVWGDEPPRTARTALQGHVSKLRKLLGEDPAVQLETRGAGYLLRVDPERLDLMWFERQVENGRSALGRRDFAEAEASLAEALALWRGEPLADLDLPAPPAGKLATLSELRATAFESLLEARLALGQHTEAIPLLEGELASDPLNERLHALASLAMYRAGRQSDALAVLGKLRRSLSSELGLQPGPAVELLERRILNRDPDLEPPSSEGREPDVREARKPVTALVARLSLVGGGLLDPELERRELGRLIEQARLLAEGSGALVYEELGGRLALIYGVPEIHEDDAVRAVRTSAELRDACRDWTGDVPGLVFDLKIGLATGDVLIQRKDRDEVLLSADPVRIADQLSSVARPGEILLTRATMRLAEGGAVTDEAAPLVLDVGPSPMSVFRLAAVGEGSRRRLDLPLVGRTEELGLLHQTLSRVAQEQMPSLVTVLGSAGVGKSKLVSAFLSLAADEARVLSGRCLSYGREITYWPVAEMVREVISLAGDDTPEIARSKIARVIGRGEDEEFITEQVLGILGLGGLSPIKDDVFWALRRCFETLSRERALILVFDDLHWAEPTLLDLIEHIAVASRGTPLMLLCLARPDLLEQRVRWGGGRIDTATLNLGPLSEDHAEQLIANLLRGADLAAEILTRLLEVAEGHPLFLEEMLAMLIDEGMITLNGKRWEAAGDVSLVPIPPTISALLGARIDRLSVAARSLAECAAVVGKEFDIEDVRATSGADPDEAALRELGDRDLILSEGSAPRGRRRFRFRHLLIRDALYQAMPKDTRARAHAAFGSYLEGKSGDRVAEVEEIVGYHLEAAYLALTELGETDRSLAARAAHRLAAAGTRAFARDDMRPAARLLARSFALCEPMDPLGAEICWRLGVALFETGELDEAGKFFDRGIAQATRTGAVGARWRLLLESSGLRLWKDPEAQDTLKIEALAEEAISALDELHDQIGMARAYRLKGDALARRGKLAEALEAYEVGRTLALGAGDRWEASQTTLGVVHGPLPVHRCIEVAAEQVKDSRRKNAEALASLGLALAMDGRTEESDACLDEAVRRAHELGVEWKLASISMYYAAAKLMADEDRAAEEVLRPAVEALQRMGERSMMSTAVAMLAEALCRQGRWDEAMLATVASEAATAADDLASQMAWRGVRAKILALRGEHRQAEALARTAVSFAQQTDLLNMAGDAHLDLATVLLAAGRDAEAEHALTDALALYRKKENRVSSARAERMLEALVASPLEKSSPQGG